MVCITGTINVNIKQNFVQNKIPCNFQDYHLKFWWAKDTSIYIPD